MTVFEFMTINQQYSTYWVSRVQPILFWWTVGIATEITGAQGILQDLFITWKTFN